MLVVKTIALVALLTQQAAASPAVVHGHGEIDSTSPSGTSHFSRRNQPINLGAALHSAGTHLKALKPKHLAGVVGAVGLGGAGLGYNAHKMGHGAPQVTVGGHPDDGGGMRKRNLEGAIVSEAAHSLGKPVEAAAKTAAKSGKKLAASLGFTALASAGAGYSIHSATHPKRDLDVVMFKRNVGEAQAVKSGMSGIKNLLGGLKGKTASELLGNGRQVLKNVPTKAKVAAAGAGGLGAGMLVGGHVGSKHGRQQERMQNGGGGGGGDMYKRSDTLVERGGACLQRRDLRHSGPAGSCMRDGKLLNRDVTPQIDDDVVGGDLSKRSNIPAAAYAKFPPGSGGDIHLHRRDVGVDGSDDDLVKRMKLPPMSKGAKLAAGGAAGGSALLIGGALGHGAGRRESIKNQEQKTKMENAAMSGGGSSGGGMYKRALPTGAKVLVGLGVGGIGAASWAAGKHMGGLSGQADALKTRPGGMGGGSYYKRNLDDIDNDDDDDMNKRALTTGAKALIGLGVGGVGAASFMAGKKTGSLTGEAGGLKSRPGGGMMYKRDDDLVRRSTLVNGLKGVGVATAVGGLGLAGYHAAKPLGRHSQDRKNARAAKAAPAAPMEMSGGGGGGGQMMRRDVQPEARSLVGAAALVGGGLAGYGITKAVVSDSRSRHNAPPEPPMMMAY